MTEGGEFLESDEANRVLDDLDFGVEGCPCSLTGRGTIFLYLFSRDSGGGCVRLRARKVSWF